MLRHFHDITWYKSHMLGHPLRRGWNLTKLLHCIVCASAPLIFLETKNALNHHTRIKEYTIRSGSQKRALSKINTMVVSQLFLGINQNWGGGLLLNLIFSDPRLVEILKLEFGQESWLKISKLNVGQYFELNSWSRRWGWNLEAEVWLRFSSPCGFWATCGMT